jgi:hypothetical protein
VLEDRVVRRSELGARRLGPDESGCQMGSRHLGGEVESRLCDSVQIVRGVLVETDRENGRTGRSIVGMHWENGRRRDRRHDEPEGGNHQVSLLVVIQEFPPWNFSPFSVGHNRTGLSGHGYQCWY